MLVASIFFASTSYRYTGIMLVSNDFEFPTIRYRYFTITIVLIFSHTCLCLI